MTKEQAIKGLKENLCALCAYGSQNMDSCDIRKCDNRDYIKALEQQPSDDVMAIHTQGLDEGIRCAMCTNSMKSDTGCDGGCVVDEGMYKKVMDTINNQMFSQPTSDDCVSRKAVAEIINKQRFGIHQISMGIIKEKIESLPPVTPTHGICKDCSHCYIDEDGHGYHCEKFDYTRFPVYADYYCKDFTHKE